MKKLLIALVLLVAPLAHAEVIMYCSTFSDARGGYVPGVSRPVLNRDFRGQTEIIYSIEGGSGMSTTRYEPLHEVSITRGTIILEGRDSTIRAKVRTNGGTEWVSASIQVGYAYATCESN